MKARHKRAKRDFAMERRLTGLRGTYPAFDPDQRPSPNDQTQSFVTSLLGGQDWLSEKYQPKPPESDPEDPK